MRTHLINTALITIQILPLVLSQTLGPVVNRERLQKCQSDLEAVDDNGFLTQDEYAKFIGLYSNGQINTTYLQLQYISLSFVKLFNKYSCNPSCGKNAPVSPTNCCLKDEQYVPIRALPDSKIDDLFYFCNSAGDYIASNVKTLLTPSPTTDASLTPVPTSSVKPRLRPSTSPTRIWSSTPQLPVLPPLELFKVHYSYTLTTKGFDSAKIYAGIGNNIRENIINATSVIVKRILSDEDLCGNTIGRRLASFDGDYPVKIKNLYDKECTESTEGNTKNSKCVVVVRVLITLFLDPWEESALVKDRIISGLRKVHGNDDCFLKYFS